MAAVLARSLTRCALCDHFGVLADSRLCGPCAVENPDFAPAAVAAAAPGTTSEAASAAPVTSVGEEAEMSAFVERMRLIDAGETPPTAPTARPTTATHATVDSELEAHVRRMVEIDDALLRAQQAARAARCSS